MVLDRKVVRVPMPSRRKDGLQIMSRRPADGLIGERVVGYQCRRIAFTAGSIFDLEISADDVPQRFKQLLHGRPVAGSKIERAALAATEEMFDRACMRVCKIEDMNEIPHAGPVAGIVVCAEHLEMRTAFQCRIHRDRDRMRFRRMPLADPSLRVRAGRVEIAQDERPEALILIEVLQDLLDDEFASAIRIDWRLGVALVDRSRGGNSVCGAGR